MWLNIQLPSGKQRKPSCGLQVEFPPQELLRQNPNTIFSIQFEKRNGTLRNMTARTGVWKGPGGDANNPRVSGVGMAYTPSEYNLKTVFDMQKGQYRHIGTDRVTKITIGGRSYSTASAQ